MKPILFWLFREMWFQTIMTTGASALLILLVSHTENIDEIAYNVIYYSSSTIAQTLAGALGLLGAFAIIRLQNMDKKIGAEAKRAYEYYEPSIAHQSGTLLYSMNRDIQKQFCEAYEGQDWAEMNNVFNKNIEDQYKPQNNPVTRRFSQAVALYNRKIYIQADLASLFLFTVLVIFISLTMLAVAPFAYQVTRYALLALPVVLTLTVNCLFRHYRFVSSSLHDKKDIT